MAQVEFHYNGANTIIQCQEEQKMSEICNMLRTKLKIDEKKIMIYLYDGKGGD